MIFQLAAISFVCILSILAVRLALTEIAEQRVMNAYQRHPYARSWRKRPLVSIVVDGEPTPECRQSVMKCGYKKLEIISSLESPNGELIIRIKKNAIIPKGSVAKAVRFFQVYTDNKHTTILPEIHVPHSTAELFASYHQIASAPFIIVGSLRNDYMLLAWLVHLANCAVFLYTLYLAILLQPALLLSYLAGLSLWLTWTIWRYRAARRRTKILFLLLAPASVAYFAYRCISAPFRYLPYRVVRHENAMIRT